MNISAHFTLEEAIHSDVAIRLGINNEPPADILPNIIKQAAYMEQVRTLLGAPIIINSWYRSPELNKKIGGSKSSAHMKGLACDFVSPFGSPLKVAKHLLRAGLTGFDQLIYEGTWIHLGLADKPRGQVMTAKFTNGKPDYFLGIVE